MIPTIGRIVHYTLTEADAEQINRRRTDSESIRKRLQREANNWTSPHWLYGAQAHIGLTAEPGDVLPAMVVYVNTLLSTLDCQVFLRGNDVLFVANVYEGPEDRYLPGSWRWPPRS